MLFNVTVPPYPLCFSSNYHIEMSPGDAGIYDRLIVQVELHYSLEFVACLTALQPQ